MMAIDLVRGERLEILRYASTLRRVHFDFSPYAAVLLDLDGTIYHEDHVLPGAAALVARLQCEGRKYACLTNSTSSPHRLQKRLAGMGIAMTTDHIYTAAAAAADYLLEHLAASSGAPARVFNLATEGLAEMLEGRVTWVNRADEPCDAVIAGAPANVYATPDRQRIALYLLRAGATLIGICADRVYPSPHGLEFGSGAMTTMLAYAADVTPVYTGKPEPIFFQELCQHLGVDPARCVLVGDNLESDIAGAKRLGMTTILTLTGVTQDQKQIPPQLRPDYIINDLTEL
jgi:HAD superfamily hydrolase (TIGR01450 family)